MCGARLSPAAAKVAAQPLARNRPSTKPTFSGPPLPPSARYVLRRVRERFREHRGAEPGAAAAAFAAGQAELEVARRQAVVFSLYAAPQRSIMELGPFVAAEAGPQTPAGAGGGGPAR